MLAELLSCDVRHDVQFGRLDTEVLFVHFCAGGSGKDEHGGAPAILPFVARYTRSVIFFGGA